MTGCGGRSERAPEDLAPPGATVVVPVLDEEATMLPTQDALDRALARGRHAYEIIVVGDGSRDRTPELLTGREGFRFTSADVGYLVAGGTVLALGAYGEGRVRRRSLETERPGT